MAIIPQNYDEFRVSEYYVCRSMLRRYNAFRPGAVPIEEHRFKDEDIYRRQDVVELHARTFWQKLGRQVKKGEVHYAEVKGHLANGKSF